MENGNETHRNENQRERNPEVTQASKHTELRTVEGRKKQLSNGNTVLMEHFDVCFVLKISSGAILYLAKKTDKINSNFLLSFYWVVLNMYQSDNYF